jgi:hypothetical protein
VVGSPAEADFILAHGTEAVGEPGDGGGGGGGARDASLEELRALLRECAAEAQRRGRPMPMVVANPGRCCLLVPLSRFPLNFELHQRVCGARAA